MVVLIKALPSQAVWFRIQQQQILSHSSAYRYENKGQNPNL